MKLFRRGGQERGGAPAGADTWVAPRRDVLRPLAASVDPDRPLVDYYLSQPMLPPDLADQLGQQYRTADGGVDVTRVDALTDRINSGWLAKYNGNSSSGH